MIHHIENLLMCSLAIHIFYLVKCLFKSSVRFSSGLFVLLLSREVPSDILEINWYQSGSTLENY